MKLDTLSLINLILIISSVTVLFSYIKYYYKKTIYKLHSSIECKILSYALDYSKRLDPKKLLVFEKYGIWRYCFHF